MKHLCITHGTMGDGPCPACKPALSPEEDIYAAYPYKVGRPAALRAIKKALRNYAFDFVLEKTIAYAKLRNGDKAFMPHPATWFNQERFNDDPSTWVRSTDNKTPVRRETIDVPITRR